MYTFNGQIIECAHSMAKIIECTSEQAPFLVDEKCTFLVLKKCRG